MNKQFQGIKIYMILVLILFSSLLVIFPIAKSNPLDEYYKCDPYLEIDYNLSLLEDPIIPFDKPRKIPLEVKGKIGGPAVNFILERIGEGNDIKLIVKLFIDDAPEGCHVSITPSILEINPISKEYVSKNATLWITVNQKIPASAEKIIKIRMKSEKLGTGATIVPQANKTKDIPFTIGYYPQLSFSYPDDNVISIGPDETARFKVVIQNWGNGDTKVISKIVDIPDGWIVDLISSTILGTNFFGDYSEGTVSLNVKPPYSFGYHEDRAIINVSMTPIFFENPEIKGEPHYLYFIVQSKGFSTPGFDIVVLLFAFIFIMYPIWKRKNGKIEKNQFRRRK